MKNKFRILTLGVLSAIALPNIVDAASLSFSNNAIVKDNTTTYQIISKEPIADTVQLQLYKSNDNADVKYDIESVYGDCDDNNLSCTLIFPSGIEADKEIAQVTVTNNSIEKADITLSISKPEGNSASKTFSVAPIAQTTTTQATTQPLSSDATLTGIKVSNGTFDQEFNKDVTTYNITGIKDTINSVTITPECEGNKCYWDITCPTGDCTISDSKKVSLRVGANQVGINVTSENGSNKRTYILNIYRGEIVTNSPYLSNLKIEKVNLSPKFDSLVNDYTATVDLDVDKLEIITTTEDPNADVIIKGNENLKEGENTITITVTSSDGANKQVYTILVTKEKTEKKKTKKKVATKTVKKKKNNTLLIVILSILGVGIIIGAYFLIFKFKKNKKNGKNNNKDNNKPQNNSGNTTLNSTLENKNDVVEEESKADTNPLESTGELDIPKENAELSLEDLENDEQKQDIDDALDDLMKTKKLELGDLDF